jgi:hypothetical protein
MLGRVEPILAVSKTAATPASNPVRTKSQKRMRFTGMPENCAAMGLFPMAKSFLPNAVLCNTMVKTAANNKNSAKEYGMGGHLIK